MTPLHRFRAALARQATDRLPCQVITMRFASRLIGRTYREYVMDHRVLVEAQEAVCETFGVDCLQTISDPCRETDDLGGACIYPPDEAPSPDSTQPLLADKATLLKLTPPDPWSGGRMTDRIEAIKLFRARHGNDISVQGWVEGPVALGVDLRSMMLFMLDTIDDPPFIADLFDFCVETEIEYARAQVEAGADTIGIGDAASSLLSRTIYDAQVFDAQRRLVQGIKALGCTVRWHVCGNITHLIEPFGRLGVDLIDVDYLCDLAHARKMAPDTALLGNLEPVRYLQNGTPAQVAEQVAECHRIIGPGCVIGAGCEVPPDAPHANLMALTRYAAEYAGIAASDS